MKSDNLRRGAFFMIVAAALFAGMGALVKRLSAELPNEMVVFFRSAIGLLVLLPWLAHRGGVSIVRTRRLPNHILRSLAGLASMYCFFYALANLPLAEAVLLNYSAPLFIPFVAWFWLEERVPTRLFAIIVLGFVGVGLILKPGLELFTPVALVGVAAGVLAAVAMTGVRALVNTEPASRIVFYFTSVSTLASAVPLIWSWKTPQATPWLTLVGLGVCASSAQLFMTRAYAYAPAAQTGPFMYTSVIFATLFGWMFWGELPDLLSIIGAVVVCIAGVLTIRYGGKKSVPAVELPPDGNVKL